MYDTDSRGARLLERSRLPVDHQRLILVGTGQSLAFDSIYDAMILQHPEFRAPPPVVGRDGQAIKGHPKGQGRGAPPYSPGTNAPGKHNQHQESSGKGYAPRHCGARPAGGGTFGAGGGRRRFRLGAIDEEQPDEDFDDHPDEVAADEDPSDTIAELASVLTEVHRRQAFWKEEPRRAQEDHTLHCVRPSRPLAGRS